MAFIYVITNDINGKQYVGKTNGTIQDRFNGHISDSKKRRCEKRPLYSAMRKYGVEHFYVEQLEECSSDDAPIRESYWIDKLQTYGSSGYNATKGGDGKKYYDYNQIVQKFLELQSQSQTADFFKCDVETVRTACMEAGIQTDIGQKIANEKARKAVLQCNKFHHNIIYNKFNSLSQAGEYLIQHNLTHCKSGTIRTHISEVCRGKRKSAAGFYWCFIE